MLAVEVVSTEPLVGGIQGTCHHGDLHPPFRKVQSSLPLFWSVVDYT